MPHVLCASDKFRGTATAEEIGAVVADVAARSGWTSEVFPVSDGGEGFLAAMGGRAITGSVTGPLGTPVEASWHLVPDGRTAVVEVAQAAGLLVAGGAAGNDPVGATTRGVGEQVVAALAHGARRIVLGCGGSASTDGGRGLVDVVLASGVLEDGRWPADVELVAATDVRTLFLDAATVFGPQKGADPATVLDLTARLRDVAQLYLSRFGVDVRAVPGTGAAGGVGGAVVALGGRVESGFDVVADQHDLDAAIARADLVLTGEGRLDATSTVGKVVGQLVDRVAALAPGSAALQVVVGSADPAAAQALRERGVAVDVLADDHGLAAAVGRTRELLGEALARRLAALPVGRTPG